MANYKLTNPQTVEESIDLLQSLLAKNIPSWTRGKNYQKGYRTFREGFFDKSPADVLDSLLYEATGGHPPYIQLFEEDEWRNYLARESEGGTREWWPAEADTGKKTRHSDPSEVTPDTLKIRNLSNLIAEIPHLLQYRDPNWLKPKEAYSWAFSSKDWKKKYTTPGEFEHEAHSIIEPLIKNLLSKTIPENYRKNLLESLRKDAPYSGEGTRRPYIK
jgi:hypothetical protein